MQHRRDRRAAGGEGEVRAEAADEGTPPRGAELSPERIAMTNHPDDLLHVASCRTCRDRFTADNVVNFDADRHREPERMREFLETARRLERERSGVQDVVANLLRTNPPAQWSALAAAPELRS